MKGNLETRRPDWVTVAGVLMVFGAVISGGVDFFTQKSPLVAGISIALHIVLLAIAVGVLLLKKWAYWSFLAVVTLGTMNTAVDLLFMVLGITPNSHILVMQIAQLGVGIAWITYFVTQPVRLAFEIDGAQQYFAADRDNRCS